MSKIERLLRKLKDDKLDGLLLITDQNIRYVTGFTGSDSFIIITPRDNYFITDGRYVEQVEQECPEFKIINWRQPSRRLSEAIRDITVDLGIKRLGFEKNHVNYELYEDLSQDITDTELIPTKGIVESIRYKKDDDEILKIRKACEISEKALNRLLSSIKPGVTEKELVAELEYYIKKQGADGVGFETILISGKRTSLLHGKPSDKRIEHGDFITIDFGAMYDGYICDMTRTLAVGEVSEKQRAVYEAVKEALSYATNSIKANIASRIPCERYNEIIERAGYLDYYYPNLGHGVGLFVHEEPFMGPASEYTLEKNCIITVEPGVYIPDWGGVRIEDMVLVMEEGFEILTKSPKDLIII
ncbi:M24 family metallopeptidase [Wukongibacter sp. M2B1]|uniref:M24 family metallopeptidase n=1 Tax=Wukongibacter sp. M2B1 TaxID=3088895 RepID=UPI003D78D469